MEIITIVDVDALYKENPRNNPNAEPLSVITDFKTLKESVNVSSAGSSIGTGGIFTIEIISRNDN